MKKFADKFVSNHLQPQMFSILLVVIIITMLSLVIYYKVKKQPVNKAPSGLLLFAEQYVMVVDNLFHETTEGKFEKPAPYIFTLLTFLGLGNLFGMLGLEPPASSYSVSLVIGLIAWVGIFVVGLMYKKFYFFKKYLENPIEIIGQFAPLISLSFRLFGNLIASTVILTLIYTVTGYVWHFIPYVGEFNLLGSFIAPVLHIYFDILDGIVQAFVFTILTMTYWTMEAEPHDVKHKKHAKVKKIKNTKLVKA